MLNRAWITELSDAAKFAWTELRLFWVRDVWPLLMTLGIFVVFAAPLAAHACIRAAVESPLAEMTTALGLLTDTEPASISIGVGE